MVLMHSHVETHVHIEATQEDSIGSVKRGEHLGGNVNGPHAFPCRNT